MEDMSASDNIMCVPVYACVCVCARGGMLKLCDLPNVQCNMKPKLCSMTQLLKFTTT